LQFPTEILNGLEMSGQTPFVLILKEGAIVTLLGKFNSARDF